MWKSENTLSFFFFFLTAFNIVTLCKTPPLDTYMTRNLMPWHCIQPTYFEMTYRSELLSLKPCNRTLHQGCCRAKAALYCDDNNQSGNQLQTALWKGNGNVSASQTQTKCFILSVKQEGDWQFFHLIHSAASSMRPLFEGVDRPLPTRQPSKDQRKKWQGLCEGILLWKVESLKSLLTFFSHMMLSTNTYRKAPSIRDKLALRHMAQTTPRPLNAASAINMTISHAPTHSQIWKTNNLLTVTSHMLCFDCSAPVNAFM